MPTTTLQTDGLSRVTTLRADDIYYVEGTSSSKGYAANPDLYRRAGKTVDGSRESGTFYTRVSSPTYMGS